MILHIISQGLHIPYLNRSQIFLHIQRNGGSTNGTCIYCHEDKEIYKQEFFRLEQQPFEWCVSCRVTEGWMGNNAGGPDPAQGTWGL